MASIEWNKGQLITLNSGDTATCAGGLTPGQLYALFFYNSAQNDTNSNVYVTWQGTADPVKVTVPGTTANQGLAGLCFVSGSDTNTVSASLLSATAGQQLQAFIGSVAMPINTTGIANEQLQLNGQLQPFRKFTRYYAVPQSHKYIGTLQSNINQFIAVQFKSATADVYVLNDQGTFDPSVIAYCGGTEKQVKITKEPTQTITWSVTGNGQQMVWINADSAQNSQTASIAMQSLSGAYKAFETA